MADPNLQKMIFYQPGEEVYANDYSGKKKKKKKKKKVTDRASMSNFS